MKKILILICLINIPTFLTPSTSSRLPGAGFYTGVKRQFAQAITPYINPIKETALKALHIYSQPGKVQNIKSGFESKSYQEYAKNYVYPYVNFDVSPYFDQHVAYHHGIALPWINNFDEEDKNRPEVKDYINAYNEYRTTSALSNQRFEKERALLDKTITLHNIISEFQKPMYRTEVK
ncbi:hypothetical protein HYV10_02835 [Candidatus Dependentiae bacterium]|nr:hypothetical protein [Candidatus Dependentiae bacterium]